jgi:type II secretory pathway component PulF
MEAEFTLQDIVPIAIIFVVVTIVLSYGGVIIGNVQSTQTTNTIPYNISGDGLSALDTFGSNLPLLATIVVAAIIITILVVYLGGKMMGK